MTPGERAGWLMRNALRRAHDLRRTRAAAEPSSDSRR
jgi:hypothetical protein